MRLIFYLSQPYSSVLALRLLYSHRTEFSFVNGPHAISETNTPAAWGLEAPRSKISVRQPEVRADDIRNESQ